MRIPKFHPLSDMPLFESRRTLRGHAFYPSPKILRVLAEGRDRAPEEAPCVVYHSPWGHLVVTYIDPQTLNGYGWTCLSSQPLNAEWGDLGYMGVYEKRYAHVAMYWERDLFSGDKNAAAAIARINVRYEPKKRPSNPPAAPPVAEPRPVARSPRESRGVMSARR